MITLEGVLFLDYDNKRKSSSRRLGVEEGLME